MESNISKAPAAMAQGVNRLERFRSFMRHVETFPEWRKNAVFHVIPGLDHNGRGVYNRSAFIDFIMKGATDGFSAEVETDLTRTPGHVSVEWKDGKAVWTVEGYLDIQDIHFLEALSELKSIANVYHQRCK